VSEAQQTQVVTLARDPDLVVANRLHCLELIDCFDVGRRHVRVAREHRARDVHGDLVDPEHPGPDHRRRSAGWVVLHLAMGLVAAALLFGVLPGAAVPVRVGVLSLVLELLAGPVTTGAAGTLASTVKVLVLESALVLPAASAAVAFTVCWPLARPVVGVRVQLPAASAVVVPTEVPSTMTLMVLPGWAVPL